MFASSSLPYSCSSLSNPFIITYQVRIIKLWRQLEMGNVEETRAIHMILMDEKFGRFKFFKGRAYVSTSYDATTLFINDEIDEITDFKNKLLDKEEEKQTFECNNDKCTAPVISAVPRFIIPLRVQDGTGVLSLTLFDKEANKKFNKSAYELLQNTLEGHNKKDYPDVFDDLLEQKMAFKIDITNYNLQCMNTANRSYTISRMTDDSTIISTLEKKHRIEDASQSYSISGRSDNDTSQETVNLKGTLSVTDDNETPLSLRMPSTGRSTLADEKTRKTITHCDLKRNLVEVYDLDESPAQSSTKPRKNVMEAPKVDGNPKLLIPKLEK
ncbi:hypothetical protein L1987_32016 [Smallanthus sonchifolius]|uniref:Uncharacterized protein n=1 Tax=Smallanthus sonchifolius TaxID=185202 RepID=A0ACB9I8E9_9ASTR|nr:hypothetical protein L1987_32016 [Smallanthus sonchifolius]